MCAETYVLLKESVQDSSTYWRTLPWGLSQHVSGRASHAVLRSRLSSAHANHSTERPIFSWRNVSVIISSESTEAPWSYGSRISRSQSRFSIVFLVKRAENKPWRLCQGVWLSGSYLISRDLRCSGGQLRTEHWCFISVQLSIKRCYSSWDHLCSLWHPKRPLLRFEIAVFK